MEITPVVLASVTQGTAALMAVLRAALLPLGARLGARVGLVLPLPTDAQRGVAWGLAGVLSLDLAGEYLTRATNGLLPPPESTVLHGLARLLAHAGLIAYAAWLCGILAYCIALAVPGERRALAIMGPLGLLAGVALAFVVGYPALRGDAALRVLGALHIAVLCGACPAFVAYARSFGEVSLGVDRLSAVFLACLSINAGLGPFAPWGAAAIDRAQAAQWCALASVILYAALIAAMVGPWIYRVFSLSRLLVWSYRSRPLQ